jgi:UDP-N-acetyl-D-mannosaminuronic acid transferase (WecB/TagA/CpsF family)
VVGVKDLGNRNVLGVFVDAVDPDRAVERVILAAPEGHPNPRGGAAFDYPAGRMSPPHPPVRRFGFEWVHKLLQEPGRL